MMAPVPRSGWKAWRYHMAEKSPSVQPTRHRRVLTPARCHADLDDQKSVEAMDGTGVAFAPLLHVAVVFRDWHSCCLVEVAKLVRDLTQDARKAADETRLGHALNGARLVCQSIARDCRIDSRDGCVKGSNNARTRSGFFFRMSSESAGLHWMLANGVKTSA